MNPDVMARGLGWFSLGLGVVELLAAKRLARSLGMEGKEGLIQLFGAREIAHGAGCLGMTPPTAAVWSRVAGDALDMAALLAYLTPDNPKRRNVGIALAAVAGAALLDTLAGTWLSEGRHGPINRMVRARIDQRERRNEEQMRQRERSGNGYASGLAAEAGR